MTYEQALAFWYGRINYEVRTPHPEDLKLDRMRNLLHMLGNPQQKLCIIHVAGSKGKGSTAAMLAAILQQAGYRTGLFTSPHLVRVEERIQVDGLPITPELLAARMEPVRAAVEALDAAAADAGDRPTFFEIVTALAFLHFADQRTDLAVVEVGLGGRFDSTNVCQPMVALITSISFDHMELLGNSLASIAREKGGIIKPGIPAISGATVPEARQVIESICKDQGSPLRQLGIDFHYRYQVGQVRADQQTPPRVQVRSREQGDGGRASTEHVWPEMELGLLGEHQAANAAVALACIEELRRAGRRIPDQAVAAGLLHVSWPARLEVIGFRPLVVLDCAHNLASVEALIDTLLRSFPPVRRHLVLAASSDKDVVGMIRVLAPHFEQFFLTRYTQNPRSVLPEHLAELLRGVVAAPCTLCGSPREAWNAVRAVADSEDLICITGSVFLAGEMRPLICGSGL